MRMIDFSLPLGAPIGASSRLFSFWESAGTAVLNFGANYLLGNKANSEAEDAATTSFYRQQDLMSQQYYNQKQLNAQQYGYNNARRQAQDMRNAGLNPAAASNPGSAVAGGEAAAAPAVNAANTAVGSQIRARGVENAMDALTRVQDFREKGYKNDMLKVDVAHKLQEKLQEIALRKSKLREMQDKHEISNVEFKREWTRAEYDEGLLKAEHDKLEQDKATSAAQEALYLAQAARNVFLNVFDSAQYQLAFARFGLEAEMVASTLQLHASMIAENYGNAALSRAEAEDILTRLCDDLGPVVAKHFGREYVPSIGFNNKVAGLKNTVTDTALKSSQIIETESRSALASEQINTEHTKQHLNESEAAWNEGGRYVGAVANAAAFFFGSMGFGKVASSLRSTRVIETVESRILDKMGKPIQTVKTSSSVTQ